MNKKLKMKLIGILLVMFGSTILAYSVLFGSTMGFFGIYIGFIIMAGLSLLGFDLLYPF